MVRILLAAFGACRRGVHGGRRRLPARRPARVHRTGPPTSKACSSRATRRTARVTRAGLGHLVPSAGSATDVVEVRAADGFGSRSRRSADLLVRWRGQRPNRRTSSARGSSRCSLSGQVTAELRRTALVLDHVANAYTVCTPVWSIRTTGQKPVYHEPAAFNAMLTTGSKHGPMVMHAGDTIDLHFHLGAPGEGWHIDVYDEATRERGTVILNGAAGPIVPIFDTNELGNSLNWGSVHDTPNSFVWEIGHTSPYSSPARRSASRARRSAIRATSRRTRSRRGRSVSRPAGADAT